MHRGGTDRPAVTYRIAFGPRAAQKLLSLRGAPATDGQRRQRLCADIDMHHYPNCISGQLKIVSPIVEGGSDRQDAQAPGAGSAAAATGTGEQSAARSGLVTEQRYQAPESGPGGKECLRIA